MEDMFLQAVLFFLGITFFLGGLFLHFRILSLKASHQNLSNENRDLLLRLIILETRLEERKHQTPSLTTPLLEKKPKRGRPRKSTGE